MGIGPGEHIATAIERGLDESRTLVFCLSPEALESDWVTLERNTTLFRDPMNRMRRFIPLLLADCKMPSTLRGYRYLDYREETKSVLEELVGACRSKEKASPWSPTANSQNEENDHFASSITAYVWLN